MKTVLSHCVGMWILANLVTYTRKEARRVILENTYDYIKVPILNCT